MTLIVQSYSQLKEGHTNIYQTEDTCDWILWTVCATLRWPVFSQSEIPSSQCRRKCYNFLCNKHQSKSDTTKQLDTNIPDCARLIYSSVDAPGKHQYKVQQSVLRTKSSNKKYQDAHRRPQNYIPESYSRLCSDRTCQSTRCYKINCNTKRQKISYNQSVKSRKDQELRSPKVISHKYTNYQRRYQVPV